MSEPSPGVSPAGAGTATLELGWPLDLGATLGPMVHGRRDPAMARSASGWWRATRTPEGPATCHVAVTGGAGHRPRRARMHAWGPGAGWALDRLGALVGAEDRPQDLAALPQAADHPVVGPLMTRLGGLRLGRTDAVLEALVFAVLAQKVTGIQAKRAWSGLLRRVGEQAPGPGAELGMWILPDPAVLARTPYWIFHQLGVERRRARVILGAALTAPSLERLVGIEPAEAQRRLRSLDGVGPWTAAEVAMVALGDPDAVSVGDYHLPHHVAWALAGEARADDARMLELLAPFAPQRGRVLRLIERGAPAPPRFGPRLAIHDISRL